MELTIELDELADRMSQDCPEYGPRLHSLVEIYFVTALQNLPGSAS